MRQQVLRLAALLTGAGLLFLGNGLIGVLVPLRASMEGFSRLQIGLLSTSFSAGFIAGCFLTPRLLARVGHVRTFSVLAALASCCLLLLPLSVAPAPWLLARLGLGACHAGLLMVVESWISECSLSEQRGALFSVYMVINLSAVTLGQLGVSLAEVGGHRLFLLAAILVSLSLVPLGLTLTKNPEPIQAVRFQLRRLFQTSPAAVTGCLVAGVVSGAFGGLGVVYAVELGLSKGQVALFMSAAVVGGALLQVPVGRLSDRVDRRAVMIGVCLASAASGAVLALLPGWGRASPPLLIGVVALYGATVFTLYGLSIAHGNDKAEPSEHVQTSGGLLVVWAGGAILGPLLASLGMEAVGPGGVFWTTAAAHAGLALFTLVRMGQADAVATADKVPFEVEPVAGRPTPATILLHPKSELDEEVESPGSR